MPDAGGLERLCLPEARQARSGRLQAVDEGENEVMVKDLAIVVLSALVFFLVAYGFLARAERDEAEAYIQVLRECLEGRELEHREAELE